MAELNPGVLVRINNAHELDTENLVGAVLKVLNEGNRATFLVAPGHGPTVIQRFRMKLSRIRNKLEAAGVPKRHFRLASAIYPYTNLKGIRHDCVVLQSIVTKTHQITESLEKAMKYADTGRNDGKQNTNQISGGFEW